MKGSMATTSRAIMTVQLQARVTMVLGLQKQHLDTMMRLQITMVVRPPAPILTQRMLPLRIRAAPVLIMRSNPRKPPPKPTLTVMARSTYMKVKSKAVRLAALTALFSITAVQAAESMTIDVHRDANCGCCKKWISHLEANGFKVIDHVESDMASVKQKLGVAPRLASCHTAVIDGKFVEGHVPAAQVVELSKRNDLVGIAVPGMPAGSPGMEVGSVQHAYQVIGLTNAGTDQIVAEYPGQ